MSFDQFENEKCEICGKIICENLSKCLEQIHEFKEVNTILDKYFIM